MAALSVASEWLLRGYAMLADHCTEPTCYSPLFRLANGNIECPDCRSLFTRDPGSDELVRVSTGGGVNSSAGFVPSAGDSLIASQSNGSVHVDDYDGVPFAESTDHPRQRARETRPPPPSTSGRLRNECSERMGELLLSGWTMARESCPACVGVPLMQKPDCPTELTCCGCGSTVLRPSDPRAATVPAASSSASTPSATSSGSPAPAAAVASSTRARPSATGSVSGRKSDRQSPAVVLEEKIEALTEKLSACPVSELETISKLANTIGALASTLKLLQ